MNDIEQQKTPHRFGTFINSIRLWMDEQIHRRLCDSRTENVSGTKVLHFAALQNIIFRRGNVRIMSVLKNRSSPDRPRLRINKALDYDPDLHT
jgi:hypothetical protein